MESETPKNFAFLSIKRTRNYNDFFTKAPEFISISKEIIHAPVVAIESYSPGTTPNSLDFIQDEERLQISVPELEYWSVLRIIYSGTSAGEEKLQELQPVIYPNPAVSHLYFLDLK